MNMKCNKEGREDGRRWAARPATLALVPATAPAAPLTTAPGLVHWPLYFTTVSADPALPGRGGGSQLQERTWSSSRDNVLPMLSWKKTGFVPIVKVPA